MYIKLNIQFVDYVVDASLFTPQVRDFFAAIQPIEYTIADGYVRTPRTNTNRRSLLEFIDSDVDSLPLKPDTEV